MSAVDVIVVGAGFAGLAAARDLVAAGRTVRVLEARGRVGGRARRGEIAGEVVDLGGQWVGPHHTALREQARAVGVTTRPQHAAGAAIAELDGRVLSYTARLPKLPPMSVVELGVAQALLERDGRSLPAGAPHRAPKAAAFDARTLEGWIRGRLRTRTARDLFRLMAGAITCVEADQISYLGFLEYLRQGGGLAAMTGIEGGAQQDTFVEGAWEIARRTAEPLDVVLDSPVRAVDQDETGVRVTTPHGVHEADRVIVTAPPGLAAAIRYTPTLPVERLALLRRMPMGSVIKVFVAYEAPFWRRRGLAGSVASPERALGIVFDHSPSDERVGVLVGLVEGRHATRLGALSTEERRERVVADLVAYFGPSAGVPIDYLETDWNVDEWAQGGYAAHHPPGVLTAYGDHLRRPNGRIHWAGTETATEYAGYFEGALRSGARAAREVLAGFNGG